MSKSYKTNLAKSARTRLKETTDASTMMEYRNTPLTSIANILRPIAREAKKGGVRCGNKRKAVAAMKVLGRRKERHKKINEDL